MDCGKPTKEKTYAGSLSFEFSHFTEKIVVNCGSPIIEQIETGIMQCDQRQLIVV